MTETQVRITAKLYECRRVARGLLRERYDSAVKSYIGILRGIMARRRMNEVTALAFALKKIPSDGPAQMMFCAAAVEIAEPKTGATP